MAKKNTVILDRLYPKIEASMKKNNDAFKKCIGRFLKSRQESLYAIAPYDRIYFTQDDVDDFFKSLDINEADVAEIIKDTYYAKIANFNPRAAKDPFTVSMLCVVRYCYIRRLDKDLELAVTYLAFSGKFYPSIHSGSFPKVVPRQYEHVMLYVVNNKLSQKFDLKREGNLIGAVRSIARTWLDTYADRFESFEDDDIVYLIQQLHNRIKSFLQNIAELYYEAYKDKQYITYDGDSVMEDDYHLADSDSLRAQRAVEKTINRLNTSSVDYSICKKSSDSAVSTDEVKSIIEGILTDNNTIPEVKELVSLIIYDYFANGKKKDIRDIEFISYTIAPKPNSKNPATLRTREIIDGWLSEKSPQYRKRRSRLATKNSYLKSVLYYFTLTIYEANL